MKKKLYALLLAFFFSYSSFAQIRYVTQNGAGTKDGLSWVNAYGEAEFQPNLNTAASGLEFWVASGTYKPTATTNRGISFIIPDNVSVYGGFSGTETSRGLRNPNPATNNTILSGNIGTVGIATDNSYQVVQINGTGVRVDGFVITGGYNDIGNGGGIYIPGGTQTLANLIITNNYAIFGGGLLNDGNLTINNSVFRSNTASDGGGGILTRYLSINLNKCFIFDNTAPRGAGFSTAFGVTSTLTNCVIANNSANGNNDVGGGGIRLIDGTLNLINSTLSENTTTSSQNPNSNAIVVLSGTANLTNTIVYGAAAKQISNAGTINYTNSIVKGETFTSPTTNKTTDPLFSNSVDPDGADNIFATADDGLMILANSPAKDAGTSTSAPADDVIGTTRPQGSAHDIGAYEIPDNAPIITSNGGGSTASISMPENTTLVTTVEATDPDNNISPDYSITGGPDRAKFTISSTTGELRFITAPDFELPTDADGNNTYIVNVRAQDQGGLFDDQLVTVTVTNANDNAPVITSDGGGATAGRSIPENSTAVTTVTATDGDAGTTVTYSMNGGADQSKFSMDASTGALRFITAPDFENPTDADRNNTYIVVVRASDGTLSDEQTFTVTVTDVAENILPVNLVNLKAYQKSSGIQVEWTTITESNVARFEVERSADGQAFASIGIVIAKGNSTTQLQYGWLDANPINGFNYYRVKTIDNGGSAEYSSVVRVSFGRENVLVSIYPNPTSGLVSVHLQNFKASKAEITLTNANGAVVNRRTVSLRGASQTEIFDLTRNAAGTYSIKVISEEGNKTYKVVLQQ